MTRKKCDLYPSVTYLCFFSSSLCIFGLVWLILWSDLLSGKYSILKGLSFASGIYSKGVTAVKCSFKYLFLLYSVPRGPSSVKATLRGFRITPSSTMQVWFCYVLWTILLITGAGAEQVQAWISFGIKVSNLIKSK